MGRTLILELDQEAPPAGRVIAADGSSTGFSGWTELAQALASDTDLTGDQQGEAPAAPGAPG